jgi:hypothetical protein
MDRPLRLALFAGLATLALTIAMLPWSPTKACGATSATPPIIAFEMARDRADLLEVFGPPGACRDAMESDLRTLDRIDYLFMLAYGAMLFAAIAALGMGRRYQLLGVLAPLADAIENVALLSMNIDDPGGFFPLLMVAARAKFLLLGACSAAIAVGTWRSETGRGRWFALAHAPALPAAVAGCALAGATAAMTPAIALSWFALIVWAGLSLRRRRATRASASG